MKLQDKPILASMVIVLIIAGAVLPFSSMASAVEYPYVADSVEPSQIMSVMAPSEYNDEPITVQEIKDQPLLDIPWNAELQHQILDEVCQGNVYEFCMLMAVAKGEAEFQTEIVGDNGSSYGPYQVQPYWHWGRMKKYGLTRKEDLFDPLKASYVALDYLRCIQWKFRTNDFTHSVLMHYNAGHPIKGTSSNDYSRKVMTFYQKFLQEYNAI